MRRIHLFEFTDQAWYPAAFRRMQTDYLQFAAILGSGHKNLLPLFLKAMQHARTRQIVDLCSGGSDPWRRLQEHFRQAGMEAQVTLTDKFPDPAAVGGECIPGNRMLTWESGQASTRTPVFVFTYLIGYPE
jgi:hypothetical protein